jgi:hypothetical protein
MCDLGLNHGNLLIQIEGLLSELIIQLAQLSVDLLMTTTIRCVIFEHRLQILQSLRIILVFEVKNVNLGKQFSSL